MFLLVLVGVVFVVAFSRSRHNRKSNDLRALLLGQTLRHQCRVTVSASVARGSVFVPMKAPHRGELSVWNDFIEVNLRSALCRLLDDYLLFPINTSAAARGAIDTRALIGTRPVGRSKITLVGELPGRTVRLYLDSPDDAATLWSALRDAGVQTS
jgi:hypothetical protein